MSENLRSPDTGLLPCPFCGTPPKCVDRSDGDASIMCSNDKCWAVAGIPPTTKERAVAHWNGRSAGTAQYPAPTLDPVTVEACAKIADDWLKAYGKTEIQYTTAQEYACDAVEDIAEAIRGLKASPTADRPHKTMTLDEYIAEPRLMGWHSVCFDVDGFGNVGIRYHGEPSAVSSTTRALPDLKLIEAALEQAQDCINGATPEHGTEEQAREDTISKIRDALRSIDPAAWGEPAVSQTYWQDDWLCSQCGEWHSDHKSRSGK